MAATAEFLRKLHATMGYELNAVESHFEIPSNKGVLYIPCMKPISHSWKNYARIPPQTESGMPANSQGAKL